MRCLLRVKVLLCAFVVCVSVSACKKAPAGTPAAAAGTPAATAATPAGSGTPAAAPAPPAPAKPVPAVLPAVVARVNGQAVTKEEFEKMIKTIEFSNGGRPIPPDRRDDILRSLLDQLVVYTLLNQEAKTRGLTATDADVDAKLADVRRQLPTQEEFEKALQARGMTIESFKKDAKLDISANKVIDAELANVPGPSDAEAKDFYTKNPDQFKQPELAHASHILIPAAENADAAVKAKAKATAEAVLKKAKAGEDFAKLAREYSKDGSANNGGDLGEFPRGQMVPAFEEAAFALKPGQLSGIVTTPFGYHIIKLIEIKPARVASFDETAPKIKEFLERQKKQEKQNAFIEALKKKSKIEVLI